MFWKIAGFEFRYQLRQPVFWVVFGLFFLFIFGFVASDQISIGGGGGNIHENSPYSIAVTHIVAAVFFMFVTTAFVANVIVRDDETGFGPIVKATRLKKFDYLMGRFAGAYAVACLCFLAVPVGMIVGSFMPWLDPETLGPLRLEDYAWSYVVLGLPGVFLTSAIFFALATVTRSMMGTYLGVVGFLVAYIVASVVLSRPDLEQTAALAEPFGQGAYGVATKYWTVFERNAANPPLEGALLWNRLIWTGAGLAFLALAYAAYRFESRAAKGGKKRKLEAMAPPPAQIGPVGGLPKPAFNRRTAWAQLTARTRFDMAQVFKSPAFVVLLALGMANSAGNLWFIGESFGADAYPVTRIMIRALNQSFSIFPIIITIYYAGELVWRERDRRTHEIVDSTAVPDWAFVLPKTLAIALVLLATLLVSVLTAVAIQTFKGWTDYEFGKYLLWYVLPSTIDMVLLAVLAVFLQAVSPHKFVGWGLMVIYIVTSITFGNIGWDHNLYNYAGAPGVPLSDMNGQGDFWKGAAWFRAYWTAFAVLLLVLAYGLWRRGTETKLLPRLKRLPRRLRGPAGMIAAASLAAFAGLGGWIYLNTNVWNEYRNNQDGERWLADMEKTLLPYETAPRPSVVSVKLNVDLHPHQTRARTLGSYILENRTGAPLTELHLRFDRDVEVDRIAIPGARLKKAYDRFNYRIYAFDAPMQPGEFRTVAFQTEVGQRGFRNSGNLTRIVDNGTFLNSFEIAPVVGMTRQGLLQDRVTRRKHGLPPELRPAKLEDESARAFNYIRGDWVNADITVSTVAGQTPIAPGYKVSDVTANGRRTARFRTEAPILQFFSVQSADYAVKRENHKGVELAVYYDRQHPWNVDRMIASMRTSLDYYQAAFGPYQFRQARILEFPDYAQFAQAFANTMPYSEGIGFIADFKDPEKIDYVTYVTAHEMGHQWWAHQVIGADMQGATSLSETLAQYSALMVMEKTYGPDAIRKFLKFELDRYLRSRGGEALEELPLMRVENQQYIHYQKGSLVMYLLRDQMGEEAVNRALKRLVEAYAFRPAPYLTSKELVAALRAEASSEHQALITDLFERITLYDVKTTGLTSKKRADGRFDVTMTVEAKKLYADGKGRETESPLAETFDFGLFTAEPGKKDFDKSDVVLFERRSIRSGKQTFQFVTDRKPTHGGADPYNKRIDRNSDDNVAKAG
ncbi:MAG TPA: M1 family aminopeptidase [Caulobacteraceae bacterium]|nr:M1 family aminopeptidase [Caulobacteraceae bacterium]